MPTDGRDRNRGGKSMRKTHRKLFDWLLLPFDLRSTKTMILGVYHFVLSYS